MPLFEGTQQQYYGSQDFITSSGQASSGAYVLTFPVNATLLNSVPTMPTSSGQISVDTIVSGTTTTGVDFEYNETTYTVTLDAPVAQGSTVVVNIINPDLGNYQYITIQQIINNFIISYVGEGKMLSKVRRADVAFHAQRALQEFSYDVLRSEKTQEIELPPSLKMALPHDYVNYVKVSSTGRDGIEQILHPASKTSNPTALSQDSDYNYMYDADGNLMNVSQSDTWTNYSDGDAISPNNPIASDAESNIWLFDGSRYGLDPLYANTNGIFFVDHERGFIHFSSNMNGRTIILKYLSDGLATEDEMIIHKFAEEAAYKHIAHAILSTRMGIPEYVIQRYKRERFAAIRNAKLRLSNLKIEEIHQQMRGKSKQIKH